MCTEGGAISPFGWEGMIFTAPHQAQNPETLRAVVALLLLFMDRSNHMLGE